MWEIKFSAEVTQFEKIEFLALFWAVFLPIQPMIMSFQPSLVEYLSARRPF